MSHLVIILINVFEKKKKAVNTSRINFMLGIVKHEKVVQ